MSAAEATALVKLALHIANRWRLSVTELSVVLGTQAEEVEGWRSALGTSGALVLPIADEVRLRIRLIVGIFEALHTLFPDEGRANGWIHRPNTGPGFDGRSAVSVMLSGKLADLQYVYDYVQGWTQ